MKNLFKALVCAMFLATMPVAAASASAEEVSLPETEVVMAADDAAPLLAAPASGDVVTTSATVTTDAETTTTTAAETTTGTDTTTAEGETTTAAETTTTAVVPADPNRIAIQDVVINATKQDVESGRKYKIEIKKDPLNATDELVLRYSSSDESVATVDENGVVTAHKPGQAIISVVADAVIPVVNDKALETYTVLILDTSGSMYGEPIKAQREAANKFCEDTIGNDKNSNHKFAVITLDTETEVLSNFTNDLTKLKAAIDLTTDNGSTNYSDALRKAAELLSKVSADAVRNIVICSDGNPYGGEQSTTGKYTFDEYYDYAYANAAYAIAEDIKKDYEIYTLGFFHSLSGDDLAFGRKYLKDIASYDSNYAEVNKADDLQQVFADVAGNAVSYKKVSSVTKDVEINVTESKPVKAEAKTAAKANDQDSPKTGDSNHNVMLISIIFIALAGAAVSAKAKRTDK